MERFEKLVGRDALIRVKEAGGKFLWTNRPFAVEAQSRSRGLLARLH